LTNKATTSINPHGRKENKCRFHTSQAHSSCTWYINEYSWTNKAATPITSQQKRKQTNIHTVVAQGILQLQLDIKGSSSHHLTVEKKTNKVAHGILQ